MTSDAVYRKEADRLGLHGFEKGDTSRCHEHLALSPYAGKGQGRA